MRTLRARHALAAPLVLIALILVALATSVASAASLPPGIRLVAQHQNGVCGAAGPSATGTFTISGLTASKSVELRFNSCVAVPMQLDYAIGTNAPTASCGTGIVSATATAGGVVTLTIVASIHGHGACLPLDCLEVWDDNGSGTFVSVGTIPVVACFDRDGCGGLGANDVSIWLSDYFNTCGYTTLADFDFSKTIGAADLAMLLSELFSACETQSPGPGASCFLTCGNGP